MIHTSVPPPTPKSLSRKKQGEGCQAAVNFLKRPSSVGRRHCQPGPGVNFPNRLAGRSEQRAHPGPPADASDRDAIREVADGPTKLGQTRSDARRRLRIPSVPRIVINLPHAPLLQKCRTSHQEILSDLAALLSPALAKSAPCTVAADRRGARTSSPRTNPRSVLVSVRR